MVCHYGVMDALCGVQAPNAGLIETRMWIDDEKKEERTMRGLDLLHWDGDRLVRKITYKQD